MSDAALAATSVCVLDCGCTCGLCTSDTHVGIRTRMWGRHDAHCRAYDAAMSDTPAPPPNEPIEVTPPDVNPPQSPAEREGRDDNPPPGQ